MLRIITILLCGIIAVSAKAEDKGFRFEQHNTKEEAQKALYDLHPIGSSLKELEETLERAGAKYEFITNPKFIEESKTVRTYEYRKGLFGWFGWGVVVIHDDGIITEIKPYKAYRGF